MFNFLIHGNYETVLMCWLSRPLDASPEKRDVLSFLYLILKRTFVEKNKRKC
jgi:hypothetical protein